MSWRPRVRGNQRSASALRVAGIVGHGLSIDPRAYKKQEIGLGDPAPVQMLAKSLDLDLLCFAQFHPDEVDTFIVTNHLVEFLGVGRELSFPTVPGASVFIVKAVDRVVEDLLNQPVGAALHVDPADDL